MKIHLFNPETEYALASGASFYTPPLRVEKLRRENQLLPEAWAEKGDVILVDDIKGLSSEFRLSDWEGLERLFKEHPELEIEPWGWNHALVRKFMDHGVPERSLPQKSTIDAIRDLAHRRTTIKLNALWNEIATDARPVELPEELTTEEGCMDFWRHNPSCWLKAPWSSSGRGVINTAADMTEELVRQWCHGIIRRQGSVMGETGADKTADYATEWRLERGEAHYLGLSSFSTSNRGKYVCNRRLKQGQMAEEFNQMCQIRIERVIKIQKPILEEVYSGYDGLLGVDMMVERDGALRPFVEVNLRRTMGMVYLNN